MHNVIGINSINCPTVPGKNNSGKNTIKVVIEEVIIGIDILFILSLKAKTTDLFEQSVYWQIQQ